jgi:23S rRNA (adenine2503-C2)-methyltransferase
MPLMVTQLTPFRERLRALGARPCHEERLLRLWLEGRALDTPPKRSTHYLPATLKAQLPTLATSLDALAQVVSQHQGADGSQRLLLQLADGQTVETVLLPRDGICISSQVGCAVGCVFCMTGRSGLLRQVGSAEMLAQVAIGRRLQPVHKVVFMGMGEPAHNLEAVVDTIQALGSYAGIAHKNLVFSTVGDKRVFERLPRERVRPALALSLHSTQVVRRKQLLPRAPELAPEELVELGEAYARLTNYPIQYQWTLLAGINDGPDEIEGIARLLANKYAVLNLIPFNSVEGTPFQRPEWEHCSAMAQALKARGILTKLRRSAGQDVDAGCGQLRARLVNAKVGGKEGCVYK